MSLLFMENMPSEAIAEALNSRKREVCGHGLNHCVLSCGVTFNISMTRWEVIPHIDRAAFVNEEQVKMRRTKRG
jgi:hypothetical protein